MGTVLTRQNLGSDSPDGDNSIFSRLLARYRSSVETEHEQATLRLVLTCAGVLYLWLIAQFDIIGSVEERADVVKIWTQWWWPSMYYLIAFLHIISLLSHPSRLFLRRSTMLFLDNGLITLLVLHGGLFNPFIALYFWIAIGYGFRYGPSWLIYSATVSVISFLLLLYLSPTFNAGSIFGFSIILCLCVASGHGFHLLRRLRIAQSKLTLKAKELENLATRDSLTGLPNRALLMDRLEHAITHAARFDQDVAILFIDIDGLKQVNDRLGHAAGDALLIEVSKRFHDNLRAADTCARIAGDEFVVVLDSVTDRNSVFHVADLVLKETSNEILVVENSIKMSASIGIAWLSSIPKDLWSPDSLLAAADSAMYKAKKNGKNKFCVAGENAP